MTPPQVRVFRLICEQTIEERILERALRKLVRARIIVPLYMNSPYRSWYASSSPRSRRQHLDYLVIQTGQQVEKDAGIGKSELLSAIRYGADAVFKQGEGDVTEEDIDAILARAEARTEALRKKFEEQAAAAEGGAAVCRDTLCPSQVWSAKHLDWSIVTRAHVPRQVDSRSWTFDGGEDEELPAAAHIVDIGKRDRKSAAFFMPPLPEISPRSKAAAAAYRDPLLDGPATTQPGYKSLILMALARLGPSGPAPKKPTPSVSDGKIRVSLGQFSALYNGLERFADGLNLH